MLLAIPPAPPNCRPPPKCPDSTCMACHAHQAFLNLCLTAGPAGFFTPSSTVPMTHNEFSLGTGIPSITTSLLSFLPWFTASHAHLLGCKLIPTCCKVESPALSWGSPRAHQSEQHTNEECLANRQEHDRTQVAEVRPIRFLRKQDRPTLLPRRRPIKPSVVDEGFKGFSQLCNGFWRHALTNLGKYSIAAWPFSRAHCSHFFLYNF